MAISLDELKTANNLSVRSYNVCKIAGLTDIEKILDYYLKQLSFSDLKHCGRKSIEELRKLCEKYLHLQDKIQVEDETTSEIAEIYKYLDNDDINRLLVLKFNLNSKKIDARARNIAENLLKSFDNSFYQVFTYLYAQKFDYYRIRNVGKLSAEQLTIFFEELLAFANQIIKNPREEYIYQGVFLQMKSRYENLGLPIYNWLHNHQNEFIEKRYPFFDFLQLLIEEGAILDVRTQTLLRGRTLYFNNELKSYKDIASQINVTLERARQLCFDTSLVNPFWEEVGYLVSIIGIQNINFPFNRNRGFVAFRTADIENDFFQPIFYNNFFRLFINENYTTINNSELNQPKYLIRKNFLELVCFDKFINELKLLMNEKIEDDYEVSLKGFLSNYVQKEDISIENWQDILEIAEQVIFYEFGIVLNLENNIVIERTVKKQLWKYIVEVLEEENNSLHLDDIFFRLQNKVEFRADSSESLRGLLLKKPDIFINTALSTYGLKEWENNGKQIGGSIKEVAEKFLRKFDEPKHVQEIADFVCQYRDTHKKNIYSNLQIDPHKKFKVYGCGFVGLTSKNYHKDNTIFKGIPKPATLYLISDYFKDSKSIYTFDELTKVLATRYELKPIQFHSWLLDKIEEGKFLLQNNYLIINDNQIY